MKSLMFTIGLIALTSNASIQCESSQLARKAIRAIALVSEDPSGEMITDLVGGATEMGEQTTFSIWANYRYLNYSDKYEVIVEEETCRLISLRLVARNLPIKNGDYFDISLKTSISTDTLFTHCDGHILCEESNKAVLKLPDLSSYTSLQHINAFYIAGESSGINHNQLISQLLNESNNSNGYLNVSYSIRNKNKYQLGLRGGVYAPRQVCEEVLIETVTAKFENGLTLESKQIEPLGVVAMDFCLN
jgi:hypothetical protein